MTTLELIEVCRGPLAGRGLLHGPATWRRRRRSPPRLTGYGSTLRRACRMNCASGCRSASVDCRRPAGSPRGAGRDLPAGLNVTRGAFCATGQGRATPPLGCLFSGPGRGDDGSTNQFRPKEHRCPPLSPPPSPRPRRPIRPVARNLALTSSCRHSTQV